MDKIKHFQDQHKGNQFTTQTAPDTLKEHYIEWGGGECFHHDSTAKNKFLKGINV